MTPQESVYRAGRIVAEAEEHFGPFTPACLNNCSTLPSRIHVLLRHVWDKAVRCPSVRKLLDGWEPLQPADGSGCGTFWLGYYHQKASVTTISRQPRPRGRRDDDADF